MAIKEFISILACLWAFVFGGLAIFYQNRSARYFYYIIHRDEEEKLFIIWGMRAMPFLLLTDEYKDFLKNGDKEEIAKMKYYVRAYFRSSLVTIILFIIPWILSLF
jgi:hypothetical protein